MKKIIASVSMVCVCAISIAGQSVVKESSDQHCTQQRKETIDQFSEAIIQDKTGTYLRNVLATGVELYTFSKPETSGLFFDSRLPKGHKVFDYCEQLISKSLGYTFGSEISYRAVGVLLMRASVAQERDVISPEKLCNILAEFDPRMCSIDIAKMTFSSSKHQAHRSLLGCNLFPYTNDAILQLGANPFMLLWGREHAGKSASKLLTPEEKVMILRGYPCLDYNKAHKSFYVLASINDDADVDGKNPLNYIRWKNNRLKISYKNDCVKLYTGSKQLAHMLTHFMCKFSQMAPLLLSYILHHNLQNEVLDECKHTALHIALINRAPDIAHRLITHANIHAPDSNGQSPIVYTILGCDLPSLQMLLKCPVFDIHKHVTVYGKKYQCLELVDELLRTRKGDEDIDVLRKIKKVLRAHCLGVACFKQQQRGAFTDVSLVSA